MQESWSNGYTCKDRGNENYKVYYYAAFMQGVGQL